MIQGNVAPKYKRIPRYRHNKYSNLKQIRDNQRRHLRGEHSKLSLTQIEKGALTLGIILIVGLMLVLVSTRVTNDFYQHQIINVNANISKYHNLNNNSKQNVSNLQNSGRLQKLARKDHFSFSSHDVRNVK